MREVAHDSQNSSNLLQVRWQSFTALTDFLRRTCGHPLSIIIKRIGQMLILEQGSSWMDESQYKSTWPKVLMQEISVELTPLWEQLVAMPESQSTCSCCVLRKDAAANAVTLGPA